jgi:hypothetical protein
MAPPQGSFVTVVTGRLPEPPRSSVPPPAFPQLGDCLRDAPLPGLRGLGALDGEHVPLLAAGLRELAHAYLAAVMQPPVLQLRRLIIGEAARLPDLARTYYERGPERFVAALAGCFGRLAERGLLRVGDPALAAGQFAFLVLGRALDKSLFCGDTGVFRPAELTALADSAAGVFLAAYGT